MKTCNHTKELCITFMIYQKCSWRQLKWNKGAILKQFFRIISITQVNTCTCELYVHMYVCLYVPAIFLDSGENSFDYDA